MLSSEEAISHLVNHSNYHRGPLAMPFIGLTATDPPIPIRCLSMARSLSVETPEAYSPFNADSPHGAP